MSRPLERLPAPRRQTASRRRHARALSPALLALLAAALLGAPSAAASGAPSLPVIERQVMCVSCKIPLNVAQSPQADRERAFIQGLIDEGRSETQIKQALVAQYGPSVLGLPADDGFDATAYLVPLAVLLGLLLLLAALLARWRRRARPAAAASAPDPISASDEARLDADLAHFR